MLGLPSGHAPEMRTACRSGERGLAMGAWLLPERAGAWGLLASPPPPGDGRWRVGVSRRL